MEMYNIHEAKTNLSALIQKALKGERVVICNNGVEQVSLQPIQQEKKFRTLGGYEGKIWVSDDFDECDKEIEDMFFNNPNDPLNKI